MRKISQDDRILINYIRVSLILGVLSAFSIFIIYLFKISIPNIVGIIISGILFVSLPGYLILPGLIYNDFRTGMVFTSDQMLYYAFVVLTLGIGPALIYYLKFEPTIKSLLEESRTHSNEL